MLNSRKAVQMSVSVVRAFVRLREELLTRHELEKRLEHIEKVLLVHDAALKDIYQKIRPLLLPPPEEHKQKQIGFHVKEKRGVYRTTKEKKA